MKKNKVFDEHTKAVEYDSNIQLDFPVQNFFMLGSPLGMFCSVYSEEAFVRSQLPTCKYFFNVYHPSDLVAYRIEPLIKQYSYEELIQEITPKSTFWNKEEDSDDSTLRMPIGL
jgi:DDHD domain